jgi:hypothetical protein
MLKKLLYPIRHIIFRPFWSDRRTPHISPKLDIASILFWLTLFATATAHFIREVLKK